MSICDPLATDGQHECQNCDWEGPAGDLKPIRDLHARIEPGGVVPSGECPECGALTYPLPHVQRWFFVMHGAVEPGPPLGPIAVADLDNLVEGDDAQEALIKREMRNNAELRNTSYGKDTIYHIDVDYRRIVEIGSLAGGYMDDLRDQVEAELEAEEKAKRKAARRRRRR